MSAIALTRSEVELVASYIGKCRTKGCKHATRVAEVDVQDLDSYRRNPAGELVTPNGTAYDRSEPFILNGVAVSARCPEHGIYRLSLLNGTHNPEKGCDARCMNATGPNCDCSCGGANHGAGHAH